MQLQEAIKSRLESDFKIFDREGKRVPTEMARKEYAQIKSYLNEKSPRYVAIKLEKDYAYLLSILACMELGIPFVPMKHDYPEDRVLQIKEDTGFEVLIDGELYNEIKSVKEISISSPKVDPEDTLYVLFTSGSTGRPKGAQISRRAYQSFFNWAQEEFSHLSESDRFLQVSEFTFDISLVDVALFLSKNVELYFTNFNANIFKLAYELETHGITVTSTVPNNLNMLLNDMLVDRVDLSKLKTLLIAGARYSWGLYEKSLKHLQEKAVYNLYGPTEFTIYSHGKKLNFDEGLDSVDHTVSIGRPIGKTEARLLDNELVLSGPQLMSGYINDPEKSQKTVVELEDGKTWYKTGDLAFQNELGEFFITGRNDDTIKTRGYRVNLLDVDSYITRLAYVQDCCSLALAKEDIENEINTFVILKEDKSEKEMKEDLKSMLLSYQIPEKIHFIADFPTNTSGKVCKKQLKEML